MTRKPKYFKYISDAFITDAHIDQILKFHTKSQNHYLVNVSSKFHNLDKRCKDKGFYSEEPGISYRAKKNVCLLVIDPTLSFMESKESWDMLKEVPIGQHVIVILQKNDDGTMKVPYGEETMGFQATMRSKFVLIDNEPLKINRNTTSGHNHIYMMYLLKRKNTDKNIRGMSPSEFNQHQYIPKSDWNKNYDLPKNEIVKVRTTKNGQTTTEIGIDSKILEYSPLQRTNPDGPFWQHPINWERRFEPIIRRNIDMTFSEMSRSSNIPVHEIEKERSKIIDKNKSVLKKQNDKLEKDINEALRLNRDTDDAEIPISMKEYERSINRNPSNEGIKIDHDNWKVPE